MLPNGGNLPPLSMSDINGPSGFNGRGNNLNAYRGTLFYRPDNSTGYFTSGSIKMSDFYSTQATSPVIPGNSGNITSGSTVTLPSMFNVLTVLVYGASGGGGSGSYITGTTVTGGDSGTSGGSTSFGSPGNAYYVVANGGGGGAGGGTSYVSYLYGYAVGSADGTGGAGSNAATNPDTANIISGGGGGPGYDNGGNHTYVTGPNSYTVYAASSGGAGGKGGKNRYIFDISTMGYAAISALYNATIPISIGSGGTGGNPGSVRAGGGGGNGFIYISWT